MATVENGVIAEVQEHPGLFCVFLGDHICRSGVHVMPQGLNGFGSSYKPFLAYALREISTLYEGHVSLDLPDFERPSQLWESFSVFLDGWTTSRKGVYYIQP